MTSNWLNKILNHEVVPPEQAWVNITNQLDKQDETISSDLKTRMLAHETTPPAEALSSIFNALDKEEASSAPGYIERIKNHTEQAPPAAWSNIIAEIDKEEAKVIPILPSGKNLRAIYVRIVAAAAVIAILLLAVLQFTKNTKQGAVNIADTNSGNETKQNNTTNPVVITTPKTDPVKTSPANNQPEASTIPQAVNSTIQDYVKGNEIVDLAQPPSGSSKEKLQNSKGEIPMDIALMNTPNTYFSITGADGQTVKVSSKFSNLIGYLAEGNPDTQENIDVIIEESTRWRKIFAEWRDKMTNNTVAPSLSNFMDIIELSKMLEERNK